EHKAVAFDVWTAVMGKGVGAYGLRCFGLGLATVVFWGLVIPVFLEVLREQGKLTDWKGWQKFFHYTFGDIGMLRKQIGNYLDYFRPGFHPWDHDNRELLLQIDSFLAEQEAAASA
ncbi:MAG TPA: metal-dependent hydrolase, partial [Alcanivorax sp.]|nr:metal-dependent hydrolase [Alcanivorax sp.]